MTVSALLVAGPDDGRVVLLDDPTERVGVPHVFVVAAAEGTAEEKLLAMYRINIFRDKWTVEYTWEGWQTWET